MGIISDRRKRIRLDPSPASSNAEPTDALTASQLTRRLIVLAILGSTVTGITGVLQSSSAKKPAQPDAFPTTDLSVETPPLRVVRPLTETDLRERLLLRATPSVRRQLELSPGIPTTDTLMKWSSNELQDLSAQIISELSSPDFRGSGFPRPTSSSRLQQLIDSQRNDEQLRAYLLDLLKRINTASKIRQLTKGMQWHRE